MWVAVTETVCPASYSPPVVDTVPPSPADKVIVYLTTGAGGGVTGVEVSSDEQDKTIVECLVGRIAFS